MADNKQPLLSGGVEEAKDDGAIFNEEQAIVDKTDKKNGLTSAQVARLREEYGFNELVEEEVNPFLKFLTYFWGPMPIMIWLAIIIELVKAIVKGDGWPDFAVLMVLQILNGTVGYIEEMNAGNAIAALKERLAPQCVVIRDGKHSKIPSRELVPGDLVSIKLGDVVPADSILLDGQPIQVDQSALTGESLPKTVYPGEKILMGSSVKRGEIECVVCATGSNTFFGKAADLMNIDDTTGRFQKILFKITLWLLALSLLLCAIIFIKLMISNRADATGKTVNTSTKVLNAISVVIVLLVASIPIAMQVVCTSTMAVGSRRLAAKKVIVARLSAIEELAGMTILCSDKTGTLTQNKLSLRDPIIVPGALCKTPEDMIFYSALSARRQKDTQDAIDKCIVDAVPRERVGHINDYEELEFIPFNPSDKRTESTVQEKSTGKIMKISKGAPQVILGMAYNFNEIRDQVDGQVQELADRGFRALGVAVCVVEDGQPDKWDFQGLLSLFDPPREDTKLTIEQATAYGVEVKMVTGDQTAIAKETCRELGMGTNILNTDVLNNPNELGANLEDVVLHSNGFAEVFPEHKFQIVDIIRKRGHVTGMTGDGVNDAPALKRADIGIAVEGATDAAKAAADIVLTEPGLSVIIDAILRSRKIFQRMRNYCIYRIACTIQLLCFFFFAVLTVDPYSDVFYGAPGSATKTCNPGQDGVFTLPVISLVVITILNDGTIITIAHDKVIPDKNPQKWDLGEVVIISAVLGLVACLSSMILLVLTMEANCTKNSETFIGRVMNPGSKNVLLDISDSKLQIASPEGGFLSFDQVKTTMYLKVSLSDFLTVFAGRCRWFFWERRPGYALATAFCVATLCSTLLSCFWDDIFGLSGASSEIMIGLHSFTSVLTIWVYCLIWFIIQDAVKVFTYYILENYVYTTQKEHMDEQKRLAYTSTLIESDARNYRASHGGIHREASVFKNHAALQQRVEQLEKEVQKVHELERKLSELTRSS